MWELRRKDDGFVIITASTKRELQECLKSPEDQVHINSWLAPGDEIEIVKARAVPFCDGGCDGMNEDWYVESGECDVCSLLVRGF